MNDGLGSVVLCYFSQPHAILLRRLRGRTTLDLYEDDVEKVSAFEILPGGLRRVLSDSYNIHHSSPFALVRASERDELPALCDTRTESTEDDLRPTTCGVCLDVCGYRLVDGRRHDFR